MQKKKRFYVLQCSPHYHQSVLLQLSKIGITYYSPSLLSFRRRRDCCAYRGQTIPMFPGYVFVVLDFDTFHPSNFSSMKNVYGLIQFGGLPAEISQDVIADIKKYERLRLMNLSSCNYVHLERIILMSDSTVRNRLIANYLFDKSREDKHEEIAA